MQDSGVPAQVTQDSVMAAPAEVQEVRDWAAAAFAGVPVPARGPRVELTVRRQDFNLLHFGESCMETPIRIGKRSFQHGLGTHAHSEIVAAVPPGAARFEASVGIDNNDDTAGQRGSVEFSVEAGGKELARSPLRRGSDEAHAIAIDLPAGTTELLLKVDTTPDGPACDQADWADARFVLEDGSFLWLDERQPASFLLGMAPPFSFILGDKPSAELLPAWKRTVTSRDTAAAAEHVVSWQDPASGLCVTATVRAFAQYPAVDWVLTFENRGTADTPILRDIQALDTPLRTGHNKREAVLHQINGDVCGERTFVPVDTALAAGKSIAFAPGGGRPSNGTFPFFNVQYRDSGLITAVGWSGQWAAGLERADQTGITRLRAGMERTHLLLHPGERIRSPRILLMPWRQDLAAAHNRFRRLLLFHYVPQIDGRPAALPFVSQCFDRYSWSRPDWATEAGQMAAAEAAASLGCNTHWFDAAWFEGGFPNGVGNWYCKPKAFPRGLKPVGDACHKLGLKFVLWFEPERVAAGSQIAREHPEFVFGGDKGGLFKLSDPAARRWLTDLLSARIGEYGIDIYRNDFNIDPLSFWRQNDAPDRQGMTEIRYVEGHYEMWDELRAKHPGLLIDNCASGGRRIDLETCMRSHPLWRSDTSCSPGHPDWNQAQSWGLSLYIPLHTACGWTPQPYDFRSAATGGAICQWDYLNPDFPMELAKRAMAEARQNAPFWYGDFYPLTPCTTTPDHWIAYQFHRPDLDAGLVLAFRRSQSPYPAIEMPLRALAADRQYQVETVDETGVPAVHTQSGKELMSNWELRLPGKGTSLVIRYAAAAR